MTNTLAQKETVAEAALTYIKDDTIIGVGSGSTANCFIDALGKFRDRIQGAVASSEETARRLKAVDIQVISLNEVDTLSVYIDGADEINPLLQLIKGGGGAHTREKIIAAVAKQFICIADESKMVKALGQFPLPVEVIPMARSYVARQIVKLGGNPVYRTGCVTDNGNCILDIHDLIINEPLALEATLNNITGVVCHGLFAKRGADTVLLGTKNGVKVITG